MRLRRRFYEPPHLRMGFAQRALTDTEVREFKAAWAEAPIDYRAGMRYDTFHKSGRLTGMLTSMLRWLFTKRQAEPQSIAYAVQNVDGYWTGIWNEKEIAESIAARGQPSHGERVVKVFYTKPNREKS